MEVQKFRPTSNGIFIVLVLVMEIAVTAYIRACAYIYIYTDLFHGVVELDLAFCRDTLLMIAQRSTRNCRGPC